MAAVRNIRTGVVYGTVQAAVDSVPVSPAFDGLGPWELRIEDSASYNEAVDMMGRTYAPAEPLQLTVLAGQAPILLNAVPRIRLNGSSYVEIDGIQFEGDIWGNQSAILLSSGQTGIGAHHITISNCTFFLNVGSATAPSIDGEAEPLHGGVGSTDIVVEDCIVTRGNLWRSFGSTDCILRRNQMLAGASQSFAVRSTRDTNLLVERCAIKNHDGAFFTDASIGTVVRNCWVWQTVAGAAQRIIEHQNSGDLTLLHNTLYVAVEEQGILSCSGVVTTVLKGNIVWWDKTIGVPTVPALSFDAAAVLGLTSDLNLFHRPRGDQLAQVAGVPYQDLAAWQATGQDAGSVEANPLFVDVVLGDFHIAVASPAVGLAPGLGVTEDYDGAARFGDTAGAYEGADGTPPVVTNEIPPSAASDVSLTATMGFDITDAGSGVNLASISVDLNQGTSPTERVYQEGAYGTGYAGTVVGIVDGYRFSFTRTAQFAPGVTVTITINGSDVAGNAI